MGRGRVMAGFQIGNSAKAQSMVLQGMTSKHVVCYMEQNISISTGRHIRKTKWLNVPSPDAENKADQKELNWC